MACTSHHIVHTHTATTTVALPIATPPLFGACEWMETRATWPCNAPQCLCAKHLTPQSTQPPVLSMRASVLSNAACPSTPCNRSLFPLCHAVLHPHTPHAHHPCVSVTLSSTLAFTDVGLLGTATLNPSVHHSHPSRWLCIALCLCFSSSSHHSRTIVG